MPDDGGQSRCRQGGRGAAADVDRIEGAGEGRGGFYLGEEGAT
jgi:hypothetical protein